jgi:hypothetical protein
VLYYERFGADVVQRLAGQVQGGVIGAEPQTFAARFDLDDTAPAQAHEAEIWQDLTRVRRQISRELYATLAAQQPPVLPRPGQYRVSAGLPPAALKPPARRGRRPSHIANALRR